MNRTLSYIYRRARNLALRYRLIFILALRLHQSAAWILIPLSFSLKWRNLYIV